MLSRIGATEVGRRKLRRQNDYEGSGTDLADTCIAGPSASAPISWNCCVDFARPTRWASLSYFAHWDDFDSFAILGIK